MGAAGPLVCYQVETTVKTTAKRDFEDLRAVAELLDKRPPRGVNYSESYPSDAPRYAFRRTNGVIPVHVEQMNLMRPTLIDVLRIISPEFLGLLVPDIDEFLDCDPRVSAALAKMNKTFGIQILSLRIRHRGQFLDRVSLGAEKLQRMEDKGHSFSDLVWANSLVCQKKSEVKLERLARENADLEFIKGMDMFEATNKRLLHFLKTNGFNVGQEQSRSYSPRDLRKSRADISLGEASG